MSARAQHSPAPFRIDRTDDGRLLILAADCPGEGYVAQVNLARSKADRQPDGEANATLFLAAPDLLAACEEALADWPSYLPSDGSLGDPDRLPVVRDALRAAIAKARGTT